MDGADKQSGSKGGRGSKANAEYIVPFQWKPGKTGNPKGRPKNRTLTEIVREYMEKEGKLPDGREMILSEAVAETILKMVLRGNTEVIKELWNRLEGKSKETIEVKGNLNVKLWGKEAPVEEV